MANDTAKRLIGRVKDLRETLGLSQEAFAERAGMDYKYYQHVEAGRRRDIRFSTLEKLAKACGLKPWELLNFDAEPLVLAEDPPKKGTQTAPAKTSPKSPKRRSAAKGV